MEGDMPSNNAGVLIDTVLAYKNNLKIGNFITIQNPATGKELSLCIVGIYESLSFPQEAWKNGSDSMVYGQSPYSYIFCDIHSYEKLIDGSLSSSSIKIYTKNAKYLDSVNDTLSQMNLLPSEYRLVNFTESKLNMGISSYRAIASSAILLSTVSISVAAFVLSLVVVLWMRTCYKDISILITLGANRCKIILDYFLIISIISFLSLVLSLPFCVFIITSFGSSLIEYTYIAAGNLSNGGINNYMVGALNQHLEIVDYLKSQCIFLVIVWLSTLLESINILKNKPSKLFYQ